MTQFVIARSYRPWGESADWEIAGVFDLPDVEHAKALVNGKQPLITWQFDEDGNYWCGDAHYASQPDWFIVECPPCVWLLKD